MWGNCAHSALPLSPTLPVVISCVIRTQMRSTGRITGTHRRIRRRRSCLRGGRARSSKKKFPPGWPIGQLDVVKEFVENCEKWSGPVRRPLSWNPSFVSSPSPRLLLLPVSFGNRFFASHPSPQRLTRRVKHDLCPILRRNFSLSLFFFFKFISNNVMRQTIVKMILTSLSRADCDTILIDYYRYSYDNARTTFAVILISKRFWIV